MSGVTQAHHERYTSANLHADEGRTGRLDFIFDLLPPETAQVLDVGCGPGVQFLGQVSRREFTGLDVAREALDRAEANGYTTIQHDISTGLPVEDARFDLVVMTDILEHVVDPLGLIKEAHRALRPGGHALISVPNHFYLANRLRILRGKGLILPWSNHQVYQDFDYFHLRFFRFDSLCSMMDAGGFDVEHDLCDRFLAPMPAPLSAPIMRTLAYKAAHLTRKTHQDLWALHLMVIARKRWTD
ncbi:MAG: putative methyltransferase [Planctomycetota bacterium]|nr:putative methyltransferase [Planctomycetota bacterium]